ncbi:unnamed protein product [Adineta steineri]|uniref:Mediator of RNA polymerase II transcription subunit 10 n=1 Tax=Adineta steineri TaxID=433720 RepID=A0A819G981_9BILA|nr:unnamed protein product [Adineta steineri]CAF1122368.1 unnamed protein product [Adineta steineri]CAF1209411.1 unnamed protein product [Adineta steineri]CAF1256583.1 unnamed protein product [Adineta steineri]CAF1257340.1 unnamed protein product [Adineta steineri]
MSDSLPKLKTDLEYLIEKTWNLYVTVTDFQAQSQPRVDQVLNEIIGLLKDVDQMKGQFQEIQIPGQLLNYVDDLKNPQMFTRDCLQRTLERNEEINGKNETLAKFADTLAVELSSQFPNQMTEYRLWKAKPSSVDQ